MTGSILTPINLRYICCIFLSWYAASLLVLPIRILLIEGCSWQKATEPRVSQGKIRVISPGVFRSPSWLGWPVRNIHFTDDNGYLPTVMNTNPFLYRFWLTSIVTLYRLWLLSNTTGGTSEAGVAYPSGAPELTLVFVGFVLLQL